MARAALGFLAFLLLLGCANAQPSAGTQVQRLGRGLNVLGDDPGWDDPARARFQPRHYAIVRQGGFRHLRVNLQAFAHMDATNTLDPGWLKTLDSVLQRATQAHLMVILDEHDSGVCSQDAEACRPKLLAFWRQVAWRYRNAPRSVLFEIMNEPAGQVTPEVWNGMLARALTIIRQSNPRRTVVIGPGQFNSFRALGTLVLPSADRNIIVTVHYYDPFAFTHQGATWTTPSRAGMTGVAWGTGAERAAVVRDLDVVASWGRAQGRPILLGEFGAYDKGDMASRAAWTATVARAAEARGFAWSYWQFDHDFLAFDMARDAWVAPIHDALVPP